jgi:hypothetical protein
LLLRSRYSAVRELFRRFVDGAEAEPSGGQCAAVMPEARQLFGTLLRDKSPVTQRSFVITHPAHTPQPNEMNVQESGD